MARFEWLGRMAYEAAHDLQQQTLAARIAGDVEDTVLLVEHDAVITVGRSRDAGDNVLVDDVPVVQVSRGGDVTFHGPGQIVAYPIIKLEGRRADLHLHLHSLEEAVIALLSELGLAPTRDARNTGVWLPMPVGQPRKVCSIGIACRKWVTWHGLALNVDIDLHQFQRIRPCGFEASVMTRLADHLASTPTLEDLVDPLSRHLTAALELS